MNTRLLEQMMTSPWHITDSAGRLVMATFVSKVVKDERPDKSVFGEALPKMSIVGDVAVIPICGVMMLGCDEWIKEYGYNVTDVNDVEEELQEALNDPNVTMILLAVDSPGGASIAGQKLYELVEAANRKKPVIWYSADGAQICSAAYHGATPAFMGFAGRFAEVGSVGTFMMYMDVSGWYELLGVKMEIFRSGEFKGVWGPLTEAQRNYYQETVDSYGAKFRANVLKYRTAIDPADLQGQTFLGTDAAKRGFVQALAGSADQAVKKARQLLNG